MANLIPWLFIIPPALVTIVALATVLVARTPRGRARDCLRRGGQHLHRKELDDAEALFRQGLALDPDNGPLLGTLGSLLVAQDRFADALPLLDKAATLQPRDMPIRLVLGRCLLALDQPEKALAHWTAIPPDDTVYVDAQGLLANHAEDQQRLHDAIQHLQNAIAKAAVHDARPLKKELKRVQDASLTAHPALTPQPPLP